MAPKTPKARARSFGMVKVVVSTTASGGGLNSYLRIFQETGGTVREIASNDDFQGRDAGLTFGITCRTTTP